jgi:hypothetical protein
MNDGLGVLAAVRDEVSALREEIRALSRQSPEL